jgi:hypothetical protein
VSTSDVVGCIILGVTMGPLMLFGWGMLNFLMYQMIRDVWMEHKHGRR